MPELPDNMKNLVNERTRVTRERAQHAARTLLEQAGLDHAADSAAERVTRLLEDVLSASRTNRRMMEKMITDEIERSAARFGFARQSEVDALRKELSELRLALAPTPARKAAVRKASSGGSRKGRSTTTSGAGRSPAHTSAGQKSTTRTGTSKSTTRTGTSKKSGGQNRSDD